LSDEELIVYELAHALGVTLQTIFAMPYDEFVGWISYFDRKPLGWKEDMRTAYVMNTFGDKRKPSQIFDSLAAIEKFNASRKTSISTLKGSVLYDKLLNAKGGDKLDILREL